ncbi:ArsA family ATPase [Streptomyces sp. GC420]|uniref:ArsA family ATPase n=1 Tax=Streptomyces sp. GC420 TaxID=2697568 RepID=UPI001414EB4C|nr:ArsA family ATPase [Streptomyces sp. GC420]NBM14886.1 ArsA family ATPase [Streptomyces sp. GC420]
MRAPKQTLLVTGPGGAGRTTVAAATALAAARAGRRTLVLSTDREDTLGAVLGTPLAGTPATGPVEAAPGLWATRTDPGASFRSALLTLQERGTAALDLLGAVRFEEEELTELPGSEEFALLRALREAGGDDWDLLVVDLPPTPGAVPLLARPEQLRRYLRRLLPEQRQAARALRPVLAQLAGVPMPARWLYESAARWDGELAAVQALLEPPSTTVRLVAEPGPAAAEALRTTRYGLALHGLTVDGVVANRLLPPGSRDPWLATLVAQQDKHLAEWEQEYAGHGIPLTALPHLGRDPRGTDDLAVLVEPAGPYPGRRAARRAAGPAADTDREPSRHGSGSGTGPTRVVGDASDATGDAPGEGLLREAAPDTTVPDTTVPDGAGPRTGPAARHPGADPWTVENRLDEDGVLVWRLPLPGARREELELVRRGDELLLTVGPFRRIVPLAPALRRCTVSGAGLAGGELRVRFAPDPELWPRTR